MDPTILAYIAGFLDGDGSIFFQIVRRKDYVYGFQIRSSLAFYQKSDHQDILHWLKQQLQCGYIRHRKTGISDLTIVEPGEVARIMSALRPYVRLKQPHVELGMTILQAVPLISDTPALLQVCDLVDRFRELNYSKKRRITAATVREFLKAHHVYTPVETDPEIGESSVAV